MSGRPTLLAQLQQRRWFMARRPGQEVSEDGWSTYLLVALWVMLSDGPGSGSDHPAPHSLPVLLRDADSQETFELGRRAEVVVGAAGQVLSPAVQLGTFKALLQGEPEVRVRPVCGGLLKVS